MGLKSESNQQTELIKRYKEVCADLNLDKSSADEAQQSFQRIGINYTLEVCNLLYHRACHGSHTIEA